MKLKLHLWELDPQGFHPVIKATLYGQPVWMLVDTGANHICFDRTFIESVCPEDAAEIARDDVNVAIGGEIDVHISKVNGLKIGNMRFPDLLARLLDLQQVNEMYEQVGFKPIRGILGGDFLKSHRAVIDYATQTLILHR